MEAFDKKFAIIENNIYHALSLARAIRTLRYEKKYSVDEAFERTALQIKDEVPLTRDDWIEVCNILELQFDKNSDIRDVARSSLVYFVSLMDRFNPYNYNKLEKFLCLECDMELIDILVVHVYHWTTRSSAKRNDLEKYLETTMKEFVSYLEAFSASCENR